MSQVIAITQPSWIEKYHNDYCGQTFISLAERMQFVITCQQYNVEQKTGGPFAAAVFEQESGKLVSLAVNCVEMTHCCCAHAETLALIQAEQSQKTYNLAAEDLPSFQLVSSGQMCIMCYGAIIWSGVSEVVFGATAKDIESINGFDEGPLPHNWQEELERRHIHVIPEYQREQAKRAHYRYRELGGTVYSPK